MDEATENQNDEVVDTIEKPKRKATKKQLESLKKARERKTQLQKERRNDAKQTQQLMNSYVEQNTFNTDLKEEIGSLRRQMEEMKSNLDARFEQTDELVVESDEESEYESDEEEYPEPPVLRRENAFTFV